MRLSVSNLAWSAEETPSALERLFRLGVQGIEVAPTRIADWPQLTEKILRDYRSQVETAGLRVSSFQAILFGKPEATLLGNRESFAALQEHMRRIADMADLLGATALVFGAPKNRLRGTMQEGNAFALAVDRCGELGKGLQAHGSTLVIEPVPQVYGSDFLTSAADVLHMVKAVNHPKIRVHLDTGCVKLGNDSIASAIRNSADVLYHFHAAEPALGDFSGPVSEHASAAAALREVCYDGWIAIEMRETPTAALESVEQAVQYVQSHYFSKTPVS